MYEEATFIDRIALLDNFRWVKHGGGRDCGGWQSSAKD
jgi:hypothetical protein